MWLVRGRTDLEPRREGSQAWLLTTLHLPTAHGVTGQGDEQTEGEMTWVEAPPCAPTTVQP